MFKSDKSRVCKDQDTQRLLRQHFGYKTLVRKILRANYYWPAIETNIADYVQKCERSKKCANIPQALTNELHSFTSLWSFVWWGINIMGPFPRALGQVKYLVVVVDYFTKRVEAETLVTITAKNIKNFVFR